MTATWTAERRAAHSERMRQRHADPAFKAKITSRLAAALADPAEKARRSQRMRRQRRDPEFNARQKAAVLANKEAVAAATARLLASNFDPAVNARRRASLLAASPLARLTPEQRREYRKLRECLGIAEARRVLLGDPGERAMRFEDAVVDDGGGRRISRPATALYAEARS